MKIVKIWLRMSSWLQGLKHCNWKELHFLLFHHFHCPFWSLRKSKRRDPEKEKNLMHVPYVTTPRHKDNH